MHKRWRTSACYLPAITVTYVSQRENPDLIHFMVSNRVNGLISNWAEMRTAKFQMQFLRKFYP